MKSIFLKLSGPDIRGECADKEHAHWIELNGWEHRIKQTTSSSRSTAGGHATGRAEHGDMLVVKELDMASPLLCQAASGGTTFNEAQMDFYRSAGDGRRVKYLEVRLRNVLISQIAMGVDDVLLPVETISMRYASVQWKYQKQGVDGSSGGSTVGAWSLTKNDRTFAV